VKIYQPNGFEILPSTNLEPDESATSLPYEPAPAFSLEVAGTIKTGALVTLTREVSVAGSAWSPRGAIPLGAAGVVDLNAVGVRERLSVAVTGGRVQGLTLRVGATKATGGQHYQPGEGDKVLPPIQGRMIHVNASGAGTEDLDFGADHEGQWLIYATIPGYLLAHHELATIATPDETAVSGLTIPGPLEYGRWVSYWLPAGFRYGKWKVAAAGDLYAYKG